MPQPTPTNLRFALQYLDTLIEEAANYADCDHDTAGTPRPNLAMRLQVLAEQARAALLGETF
jgi:hypothetical protein